MSYMSDKIDEFILGRIKGGGTLRRSDLMSEFQISVITASKHIQRFIGSNPEVMVYDMSLKCYKGADQ